MIETGITKNQILAELVKSPHGKLSEYVTFGKQAAGTEPEFYAHMIAYNYLHGQIRDSKVALPVVSLSTSGFYNQEFTENSLAHLALLDPRNLVRAYRFSKEVKIPGHMESMKRMIKRYLRNREANWGYFTRTAVQHRKSLKELYALVRVSCPPKVSEMLFGQLGQKRSGDVVPATHPMGSAFYDIAHLKDMSPAEAAAVIVTRKIPALIALGALGEKVKDISVAMAVIDSMSPSELITNTKLLEGLGIKKNPALRAAYEKAIARAATSKKNTLKTTAAIEAIEDEGLKDKLRSLQDKQIKATGGMEGNWLILADKSGSMHNCVEAGRQVAGTITKFVNGNVWLVFFDTHPRYFDVTGMGLDQIKAATRYVNADGGTSIGCGMRYAIDAKLDINGIIVISDGGENSAPFFSAEYQKYCKAFDAEPTVYFLFLKGGEADKFSGFCKAAEIDVQKFDLPDTMDYYSLPNLISGLRVSRYSKIDEVMGVPLLTLDQVFEAKHYEAATLTA